MWKKVFAKEGRSFGWYHGGEDSGGGDVWMGGSNTGGHHVN